jgi:hypothetical protein
MHPAIASLDAILADMFVGLLNLDLIKVSAVFGLPFRHH